MLCQINIYANDILVNDIDRNMNDFFDVNSKKCNCINIHKHVVILTEDLSDNKMNEKIDIQEKIYLHQMDIR